MQNNGFGFGAPGSTQANAAASVAKSAMTTIGKQVGTGDDVEKEAKQLVTAGIKAIQDAEMVLAACETDYAGPSALRLVGNDAAATSTNALFEMVRSQVMANPRPMKYANDQFDSLLTIEAWDKADAFVEACKPLIVQTLGTPQPVLAARQGQNGSQVWDGEHALAHQLRAKIADYERARRPDALSDGPRALDAIKQLFCLVTGTSPVWLNRGQRDTYYRTEQRDAAAPWSAVVPAWQSRWVLPINTGMTLNEWTTFVQKILVPPSRNAK